MGQQRGQIIGAKIRGGDFIQGGILFHEIGKQQRDVGPALPQWRQGQGDSVQPIQQVLPKFAPSHSGVQLFIGGRQNADIRPLCHGGPQGREFPRFQNAQQLGLNRQRASANFIQKQRAGIGAVQNAGNGVSLGAGGCSKHGGFEKGIWNRCTIDGNEGSSRPCA